MRLLLLRCNIAVISILGEDAQGYENLAGRFGELWLVVQNSLLRWSQLMNGDFPVSLHDQERPHADYRFLVSFQSIDYWREIFH